MQYLDILALLALAMVLSRVFGRLLRLLHLPHSVSDIVFGVLLGNLGNVGSISFDALANSQVVQALSTLGLVTLIFSAGLNSNLSQIFNSRGRLVAVVAGAFGAPFIATYVFAFAMPPSTYISKLLLVAILGATSFGLAAEGLRKSKLLKSSLGQTILGISTATNFLAILFASFSLSLSQHGGLVAAQNIVIVGAEICLLGFVVFLSREVLIGPGGTSAGVQFHRHGLNILLISLALLFSWFSGAIGLVSIFGAFCFGLILDEVELNRRHGVSGSLEGFLQPLLDFFMPVFFLSVGMQFKLSGFNADVAKLVVVFFVITLLGKGLLAWSLPNGENRSSRILVVLGTLSQGEMGLLFLSMGARQNMLGAGVADALLVTILITAILSQSLFAWKTWIPEPPKPIPTTKAASKGLLDRLRAFPFWVRFVICFGPLLALSANFLNYVQRCSYYAEQAELGLKQSFPPVVADEAIVIPTGDTDRIPLGLQLFKARGSKLVLISGGSNPPLDLPAEIRAVWGADANVEEISKSIIVDASAQTTYENAKFSMPILEQHGITRIIMVNTDIYIPRALTIFDSFLDGQQFLIYSVPSGFSKLSLALSNDTVNGVTRLWWEFVKNIIWDLYAKIKSL